MSTLSFKNLINIGLVATIPTTAGPVVTVPAGTYQIVSVLLHNTDTEYSRKVGLYLVKNNAGAVGAAVSANKIFSYRLDPGESYSIELSPPGFCLDDENDTLQAVVSDEGIAPVNITVSGRSIA